MRISDRIVGFAGVALVTFSSMACGGADSQTDPGSASDSDPNQVFTSTSIQVNADGTTVVKQTPITLAQELAENAAREASHPTSANGVGSTSEAIVRDTGCFASSLWLYDHTNRTGNRLCLVGNGTATLGSYTRYCSPGTQYSYPTCYTWSGSVRSYWPGYEDGGFVYVDPSGGGRWTKPFSATGGVTNVADWIAQAAQTVYLND
jgi:hypothetical protein